MFNWRSNLARAMHRLSTCHAWLLPKPRRKVSRPAALAEPVAPNSTSPRHRHPAETLFYSSILVTVIPSVQHRKNRVPVEHSGTCIPHCVLDAFAHRGAVAMCPAAGTGGLLCTKRTTIQPAEGVRQESVAFTAQRAARTVVCPAVNVNHYPDGSLFAHDPSMWQRGRMIHGQSARREQ